MFNDRSRWFVFCVSKAIRFPVLLWQLKPVPYIANCMNELRPAGLGFDLAAERGHAAVDTAGADDDRAAPDLVHDVAAGECSVGVGDQEVEQAVLFGGVKFPCRRA